jgi:hypothetical protein
VDATIIEYCVYKHFFTLGCVRLRSLPAEIIFLKPQYKYFKLNFSPSLAASQIEKLTLKIALTRMVLTQCFLKEKIYIAKLFFTTENCFKI